MESVEVTLPTGFAVKNRWSRSARLRPLQGTDEEAVREIAQVLLPVERITMLLLRCLVNLGEKSVIDFDDVRSLTAGDRDALLLHLRRLTYGNEIQSILTCPQSVCGEKMDLGLSISDVLVAPDKNAKATHETAINMNGSTYDVKFRLPTGADQEAVAKLAHRDPHTASELLLQQCIDEIRKNGTKIEFENNLPVALVESLSKRMAELDPQAEILLDVTCPSCKQNFLANFDIGDYFFRELITHSQQLYREVHILALHYHWSENDILKMSYLKRQVYLKLLADSLNPAEK